MSDLLTSKPGSVGTNEGRPTTIPSEGVLTDIEEGLELVEEVLRRSTKSEEALLERMARNVIFAGGKRLRPRIALLAFAACGGDPDDHAALVDAAAAFELIHAASLVHDDIIDDSPLRRGQATLHTSHGVGHAIVAGDFLFTRGFGLSGSLTPEVIAITTDACVRLAEGEVLEQVLAGKPDVDVASYLKVIAKKTAEPMRACAKVGAVLAGAPAATVEALGLYGLEVGIAFQIADDLLDLDGDPTETGKPVGLDGQAGVLTLPALLALDVDARRKYLRDPEALRATLVAEGAVDATREVAEKYVRQARERLHVLPPGPYRTALDRLAASVVDRKT